MSVITGGAIALARLLKQLSNRQALGRQSKKAGEDAEVCTQQRCAPTPAANQTRRLPL
ncbi:MULTISPECIES: hypothetical protein [Synechococcus]|uniref:hypothetical protein n=1 Tax=Synechococcus TaxID=1129 RepID=UPI0013A55100|nr:MULTISPECIES: hypothetical protein [Synechococcus]MCP9812810.1 hypothetical protein [Synechococcus lacustris L1E-Slac]